jgi:hypothetical protein
MNCRAEKLGVRFIMLIDSTAVKHGGVLADALPNSSLDASAGSPLHMVTFNAVPAPRQFQRSGNRTVGECLCARVLPIVAPGILSQK